MLGEFVIKVEDERFYPEELREYANSLGGRPQHFMYWGEYEDFDRWAHPGFGGQHRDSDTLDKSNHAVITEHMEKLIPDGFIVERSSNWLVGWSEGIRIDTANLYACAVALYWQRKLEDYPVADEDHYSQMQAEEREEDWENWARRELLNDFEEDDDLIFLLNLDENGFEDGFRNKAIEARVREAYEEKWQENNGDIYWRDMIETMRYVLEDAKEEEEVAREERRLARKAEYERYQPSILEV